MKKLIIHPWLLSIFPVLFLFNINRDMLEISDIYMPAAGIFTASVLVFLILNHFIKNQLRSGLITSLLFVGFFSFGHYINFISAKLFFPDDILINKILSFFFLSSWLLISVILAYWVIHTKKNLHYLNQYLNFVAVIIIGFQFASIFIYISAPREIATAQPELIENNSRNNLPDIYYIILDGYGRNDTLNETYDYDNRDFLESLADSGFYVAENSYANYPQTYLSLSSSLNFDYLPGLIPPDFDTNTDDRKIYKDLIKDHRLYYRLKENDYKFIGLPSTWVGTVNNQNVDIQIHPELAENNFNLLLLNTTPLSLFWVNDLHYNNSRKQYLSVFESLPEVAEYDFPTFTYIHLLLPHPPFLFSENGEPNNPKIYTFGYDCDLYFSLNPDKSYYRSKYIEQLKFLNEKIKVAVQNIIKNSKEAPIIIIQGDHGPGLETYIESLEQTNLQERMGILNAYYVPETIKKQLYPEISPVNSFRLVLNYLFGADLDILPDKSYFAAWSHPYDFIDVTDRLKH